MSLRIAAALAACALALDARADERTSGYALMSPELQQMQTDDMANPGMLWVTEGATLWEAPTGPDDVSCAGCHGDVKSLAGVAARYPAFAEAVGAPVDLQGRIELCRVARKGAEPLPRDAPQLLALTALVAHQSRGVPITPDPDPRLDPWRTRGATLFETRMGQLNLSCSICHEDNAGGRLGPSVIPQAHPTGYPQYRLEWQELGSLERRFDNCMVGMRSEPFERGSEEYLALEIFLVQRAAGLPIETPAIRP